MIEAFEPVVESPEIDPLHRAVGDVDPPLAGERRDDIETAAPGGGQRHGDIRPPLGGVDAGQIAQQAVNIGAGDLDREIRLARCLAGRVRLFGSADPALQRQGAAEHGAVQALDVEDAVYQLDIHTRVLGAEFPVIQGRRL